MVIAFAMLCLATPFLVALAFVWRGSHHRSAPAARLTEEQAAEAVREFRDAATVSGPYGVLRLDDAHPLRGMDLDPIEPPPMIRCADCGAPAALLAGRPGARCCPAPPSRDLGRPLGARDALPRRTASLPTIGGDALPEIGGAL